MQLRQAVLALSMTVAITASSCTAGGVVPRANRYANEVDGVTAGWPRRWQLVEKRLTTFTGGAVDLLVLATFDPPKTDDLGCAQDAPAAIAAMGEGDAFFRLQTVAHLVPDGPAGPRPASFMDAAEPIDHASDCKPRRVLAIHVAFEEHGRLYEAELRARSPLDRRTRDEIQTIWANLEISPIRTGRLAAEVRRGYWHEMSTHCGIIWTEFDGRQWLADPPLIADDGIGPPPGWDNPTESGTIRLEAEDSAVFTSRDGDRSARFRPRVESDPPLMGCE